MLVTSVLNINEVLSPFITVLVTLEQESNNFAGGHRVVGYCCYGWL